MTRPSRSFADGGIYHIASRGSDRRLLFLLDRDREEFLDRLGWSLERHGLQCLAYCLMSNHYHLIVETPDERLSVSLRELHTGYSRFFNRAHGHSAHLFRQHCLAQQIDTEAYLLTALRYVAHNPVRAGLCSQPGDWLWSSYRAVAYTGLAPSFLSESILRDAFGGSPSWRSRYREFVESSHPVEIPPGYDKAQF